MDTFQQLLDEESLSQLTNEFEILHLLYHRNKNQHHSSIWWSNFSILHRKLRVILLDLIDINEVLTKKRISKIPASQRNPFKSGKSKKITAKTSNTSSADNNINKKKKLNNKDCKSILNHKKKEILNVAKYLIVNKIPKCYNDLYSIIELGQYITLGFALIGLVSKIYYILQRIEGLEKVDKNKKLPIKNKKKDKIDDALSEEVGEMITILDDDDDAPVLQDNEKQSKLSKANKKEKESKAKKESKGNFLDDLFGNAPAASSSSKKRKRSKEDGSADPDKTKTKKSKDKKIKKKKPSSAGSYMDSLFD